MRELYFLGANVGGNWELGELGANVILDVCALFHFILFSKKFYSYSQV